MFVIEFYLVSKFQVHSDFFFFLISLTLDPDPLLNSVCCGCRVRCPLLTIWPEVVLLCGNETLSGKLSFFSSKSGRLL